MRQHLRPMPRDRRGAALMTAILAIAIITVAVAAGLSLMNSERRTVNDQQLAARALGIAQQGLDAYLRHPENTAFRPGGRVTHTPPRDNDTAWVPVNAATGDTAIVIPRLFRRPGTGDTMYVISSLGKQGIGVVKGTPAAERTVAEVVTWSGAHVPIKAGWMSLTGISKNGASGTLSGTDASATPCLPGGDVAGVSVPTTLPNGSPGYTSTGGGGSGVLSGNPPLDNTSLGPSPTTAADSLAKAGIDWARWSQGLDLPNVWRTGDHGGAFPDFSNPNYYPTVYVQGDLPDLPNGRGLLVVSGSLTMNGLTHWNGIVLIGGGVTANGNDNVQGAVLSGLNLLISPSPIGAASLGNGTKTIQYNSCEVAKALTGTHALVPRRGTWMDNWKTY